MRLKSFLHRLNRKDLPLFSFNHGLIKLCLFLFIAFSVAFAVKSVLAITAKESMENWLEATDEETAPANSQLYGSNFTDDSLIKLLDIGFSKETLKPLLKPGAAQAVLKNRYAFIPGGAMGSVNGMIAQTQSPAASGVEYIAEMKDSLLGKPAYAQGAGFVGLQPILPIWKAFRNVVYVLSAVIFIFISIMIILRVKISPQAVISIQNAVPQIITTLVLVTFSYAIAGLLIDLSNLIQGIVVALFFSIKGVAYNNNLFSLQWGSGFPVISDIGNMIQLADQKVIQLLGGTPAYSFKDLANPSFTTFNRLTFRAGPSWFSLLFLGGLIGSIITGTFLGGALQSVAGGFGGDVGATTGSIIGTVLGGGIGGLILPIILTIVITFWLISLYFGVIKAYVTIIVKIILAPLEIGMGAFPGSKMGFSSWIWDLISNIAIFPVINIFLIIMNFIIDQIYGSSGMWAPSALNVPGWINPLFLASCFSLAGLALLAKLPDLVPQVIFAIKPSPFGTAIGQALDFNRNPFVSAAKTGATSAGITTGTGLLNKWGENVEDRGEKDPTLDPTEAERLIRRGKLIKGAAGAIQGGAYQGKLVTSDTPGKYSKEH